MPTSHIVSVVLLYGCSDSAMFFFCHALAYAITANRVCLHLLVPPFAQCQWFFGASCLTELHVLHKYVGILQEKSTLCSNFIQKWGVGLFSWVGMFLGEYGIIMFSASVGSHCLHFFWCSCSLTSWPLVRIPTLYRTPFLYFMLVALCAFPPCAELLIVIENTWMWFCSSVDLIDSVLNPSPFCTLSGIT